MENTVVLYESKYGYTKQYAEWIASECNASLYSLNECNDLILYEADLVVFGGGVYGSMINGLNKFRSKMKRHSDLKVIYFAAGIRPMTKRTIKLLQQNNFEDSTTDLMYFQSGLNQENLSKTDKIMLKIYSTMMKRTHDSHKEDAEVLNLMKSNSEYISCEQVLPIVERVLHVKKESKEKV